MEDGGQPEDENLESTDPNHEIHVAARERAMNALMNLVDGTLEINDRVLTFCVVCRDPRPLWPNAHSMKEWWQQSTVVRKSCAKLFAGIRNTEDLVICLPLRIPPQPSYVCSFLGQATQSQSTTSPWRRNYHSDLILIQYDTQHNCGHEIANRRGAFLICGVDIAEVGPDNNDKVVELIETMSDHRDRCLPQRGDQPTYAPDPRSGYYVNEGYQSIADGVCGGILDLMPIKGIPNSFIENGNMSTPASLETCVMVL